MVNKSAWLVCAVLVPVGASACGPLGLDSAVQPQVILDLGTEGGSLEEVIPHYKGGLRYSLGGVPLCVQDGTGVTVTAGSFRGAELQDIQFQELAILDSSSDYVSSEYSSLQARGLLGRSPQLSSPCGKPQQLLVSFDLPSGVSYGQWPFMELQYVSTPGAAVHSVDLPFSLIVCDDPKPPLCAPLVPADDAESAPAP